MGNLLCCVTSSPSIIVTDNQNATVAAEPRDVDNDDPPVAVLIEPDSDGDVQDGELIDIDNDFAIMFPREFQERDLDWNISTSLLFDMVKVPYTCISLLSGWSRPQDQCTRRVEYCREHLDEAFFVHPMSGRTPLHEVCRRNACIHVVRALVEANQNLVTRIDPFRNTPLHLLFIPQSPMSLTADELADIVDSLLGENPSELATARNLDKNTPLHIACSSPEPIVTSPAVLTKLLVADPECASALNGLLQTPLHVYCKQPPARTSAVVCHMLLEAHPTAAELVDVAGKCPLHHVCSTLNTKLIPILVERSKHSALIQSGPQSETPLHVFCQQNPREMHLEALCALVMAAPSTVTMSDSSGSSPLHVLCRHKKPLLSAIRLLLEGDSGVASKTDANGYTALHYACENKAQLKVIECLLSHYENAASVVNRKHDTPLHVACSANASSKTVRLLIQANPNALTMTNDYGFTPLHCCCRSYLPLRGIVQAIIEACPYSVQLKTHGGETPVHLACSSGAHVSVLRLLTDSHRTAVSLSKESKLAATSSMTNKLGSTPLHEACFRGADFDSIEALAISNPSWITARNNAGHTPLQILCKGGRLEERVVTCFARIRGPEVFSTVDETGHYPLHSASRAGTSVGAIKSLIVAYPDALTMKTVYGDTPLHLALLRTASQGVVRLIAESASDMRGYSPLLVQNAAGQTPMNLAMDAYCQGSGNCVQPDRGSVVIPYYFEVLALLVNLAFYGVPQDNGLSERPNLVQACLSLHRQNVRLDPAFIRTAIQLYPEDVRSQGEDGNYALHIEASIPIEKMIILDSPLKCACNNRNVHTRVGLLEILLEAYPEALTVRNHSGDFPLGLMIQNGRPWSHAFALALRNFPAALHWYHEGIGDSILPSVVSKVSRECGTDTLYQLLVARPSVVTRRQGTRNVEVEEQD